jgi:zinc transport system ATP-binding protein
VSPENVLEVERLTVRFGRTTVLENLSFEVRRGTSLAVLGPNGSGKTVLFKALLGALPHEGSVRWAPGARLGYVPQKLDIERDLPVTGRDFLLAKAVVSGTPRADIEQASRTVGFGPELSRQPIGALSGGQFQRLLVAAALLGRPAVLLLDEPTAGVDEPGQQTLYERLDLLRDEQAMTTLVISHDLSVVYAHATSVLCLTRQSPCFGPPKSVLTPELLERLYGARIGYHVHDDRAG